MELFTGQMHNLWRFTLTIQSLDMIYFIKKLSTRQQLQWQSNSRNNWSEAVMDTFLSIVF
jgi:hypothetical protein